MIRKSLGVGAILLVVFHGWLLAGQAWDGQLVDLALGARWLIAAGLIYGLWRVSQKGASIFFSRHAVALWLLAALLHGPALAERLNADIPAVPEAVAALAQASTSAFAMASVLLLLALALGRQRRTIRPAPNAFVLDPIGFDALSLRSQSIFAPRPPPIL